MPNTIYMLKPRMQCEGSLERFCENPGQQYFGNTFHPRSPSQRASSLLIFQCYVRVHNYEAAIGHVTLEAGEKASKEAMPLLDQHDNPC